MQNMYDPEPLMFSFFLFVSVFLIRTSLSYTLALTSVSLAFPLEENSKKEVESNLVLVITYIKVV